MPPPPWPLVPHGGRQRACLSELGIGVGPNKKNEREDDMNDEIEKLIADGIKAGDEAARPHLISAGEMLIEAQRQPFPNDDRKFWQWALRNFREKTPGEYPSQVAERKAQCKVHLQHCIDLATQNMWQRLQREEAS